jgi:RNA polymerase sigma-70 factor (ECF subfamily)
MTTAAPTHRETEPPAHEAALMARVADGDAAAFEAVYERHARAVHSYVLAQLDRSGEAEDVCQEAFLALWRHASRFDPRRGSVRGWLIGIARNQAIDRLRARARRARAEAAAVAVAALDPPQDVVSAAGADRAEAARLRPLLDDLPPEQRDVLLLVHHGGLSHSEVAQATGLPLGTVKSRLRLGLERVRDAVGAEADPRASLSRRPLPRGDAVQPRAARPVGLAAPRLEGDRRAVGRPARRPVVPARRPCEPCAPAAARAHDGERGDLALVLVR